MSEPSRPAPGVPALARFVPVRGPWGLTGTDLSIIVFALATLFVMALSEGRYDVSHATLAALTAASWLPLFAVARRPIVVLAITVGVENLYLLLVPLLPPEQFNAIPVAVMVAAYSVGRRRPWPVAWLAGGVASARPTASALSAPLTTNHTSSDRLSAG